MFAFTLFWERLGPARIYVAAILAIILLLAAVGLWHLIAPAKPPEASADDRPLVKSTPPPVAPKTAAASPTSAPVPAASAIARISPAVEQSSPTPTPSPPVAAELERGIAIIDVSQSQQRGPRGENFIVARIGLTPRSAAEKGTVEIRVFFYDLTPNNEMHPTDAQVTYRWLTPFRDWSDPTPKYLAATYFKPRPFRRMPDRLRYGGFIVRVYADGKLQDERSQPESLISQLRNTTAPQQAASATPMTAPIASPTPASISTPPPQIINRATPTTTTPPSSSQRSPAPRDEGGNLPYGKPVQGKPGFVSSPYDPKFLIDVRGFPPGTLVIDPNTNKPFRVP